jgi:hypothetical protein
LRDIGHRVAGGEARKRCFGKDDQIRTVRPFLDHFEHALHVGVGRAILNRNLRQFELH